MWRIIYILVFLSEMLNSVNCMFKKKKKKLIIMSNSIVERFYAIM